MNHVSTQLPYVLVVAAVCLTGYFLIGVLQAIVESGRTDVKGITGGGGCQEYFNMMPEYENIWVCSATYSPDMITHCVENVAKILAGEEVEHNVVIPTTIVDRDNVEEFLNPDSPY